MYVCFYDAPGNRQLQEYGVPVRVCSGAAAGWRGAAASAKNAWKFNAKFGTLIVRTTEWDEAQQFFAEQPANNASMNDTKAERNSNNLLSRLLLRYDFHGDLCIRLVASRRTLSQTITPNQIAKR